MGVKDKVRVRVHVMDRVSFWDVGFLLYNLWFCI